MLEKIRNAFLPLRRFVRRRIKRSFLGTMFAGYRPELHYMRGSGPKSRAQHSHHATDSQQG
jgi:hypothetical protein